MEGDKTPHTHFGSALLLFLLTAGLAILLLLGAGLVWLTEVIGSFIGASLITGGFFALLSVVVYLSTLRRAMKQIRTQIDTIYEVAYAAQLGYKWLMGAFYKLIG
ncbi:MAG: hypothetical protein RR330_04190 [Alistipes sp.]